MNGALTLTLYSRPGCHLCEETLELLSAVSREYRLSVKVCDVESSLDLERRYGWLIPVVRFSDGHELCAPITEPQLRAAIRARSKR